MAQKFRRRWKKTYNMISKNKKNYRTGYRSGNQRKLKEVTYY